MRSWLSSERRWKVTCPLSRTNYLFRARAAGLLLPRVSTLLAHTKSMACFLDTKLALEKCRGAEAEWRGRHEEQQKQLQQEQQENKRLRCDIHLLLFSSLICARVLGHHILPPPVQSPPPPHFVFRFFGLNVMEVVFPVYHMLPISSALTLLHSTFRLHPIRLEVERREIQRTALEEELKRIKEENTSLRSAVQEGLDKEADLGKQWGREWLCYRVSLSEWTLLG